MSQSLSRVWLHIIFSTKDRFPFLTNDLIREETYLYISSILNNLTSVCPVIGGTSDHTHILCSLPRVITISDLIKEVKVSSTGIIKHKGIKKFRWQNGYGAFSIGQSQVEQVVRYIRGQRTHHKRVSFQDELRKFLKAYDIEYDEKYIWD